MKLIFTLRALITPGAASISKDELLEAEG